MDRLLKELEKQKIDWETDCPLSQHSSFRIGGRARLALFPRSREGLVEALRLLKRGQMPILTVGNGSNVVFSDAGFDGAVVFTGGCRSISVHNNELIADAGVSLSALANTARDASLTGLEFAFGIPGTLGGAVFMNAGAYGGSMDQVCVSSEAYDAKNDCFVTYTGAEQLFGYRSSVYEKNEHLTVLSARLRLTCGHGEAITAQMREYWDRRKNSQPLEYPSAGSVFKRPEGHFAGKLIEDCGLKGLTIGGAQVSKKHAGFIINLGSATSEDVKCLVEKIQSTVLQRTGIALECEIKFL